MATVYALGTNQNEWNKGNLGSKTSFTAPGGYSFYTTPPTVANGLTVITSPPEANSLQMAFCGAGSGKKAKVRIWLINQFTGTGNGYMGMFLAELTVTLGSTGYTGGVWGSATTYLAHTIEVVTDASLTPPGIRFAGGG